MSVYTFISRLDGRPTGCYLVAATPENSSFIITVLVQYTVCVYINHTTINDFIFNCVAFFFLSIPI